MPKENITDVTQPRWRAEVSWRPEEHVCPCGTTWTAPVADCPECEQKDVPVSSGHVQLASVNRDSPFEFPEVSGPGHWQAAEPFDGWRITLDPDTIERTISALMRAGSRAFPGWKLPALDKSEQMAHWMWTFICSADQLISEYRRSTDCGSPQLADEWRAAFVERLRPGYHEHLMADPPVEPATP